MMKKLFAYLALISCLLFFIPNAFAIEKPVSITVVKDQKYSYSVIPSGKDLLFSGEDLSRLTGFDYINNGKKAVFTRGMKTVIVDITRSTLSPMGETADLRKVKLAEKVRRVEGKYYFPGSQLLPWLNVTCLEKHGMLHVIADAVSIWDLVGDFDPGQFEFDFHKSCKMLGVNSKWLKASAYMRSKGLNMVFDAIPVSLDHTYGSYKDYFDIFDEMFLNKESSVYAVKELTAESEKIKSGFDIIDWLGEMDNLPDELRAIAAFHEALSQLSDATEYALYYSSFQQDNNEKLALVNAITLNRGAHKYPDAMIAACFDIEDTYCNKWVGLETRLLQKMIEGGLKTLISASTGGKMMEGALKVLGLYKAIQPDWVKGVARIPKYEAMAACGLDVYKYYSGGSHMSTIQMQRCHAMLYLYACEQNWRSMANYAEKKNKVKIAEDFISIADNALYWQGRFLASSLATVGDSHEYETGLMKEEYTKRLLEIFSNLTKVPLTIQNSVPLEEIEDFIKKLSHPIVLNTFNTPNDLCNDLLIDFLCGWVRKNSPVYTDVVTAAELEKAAHEVFGPNIKQILHQSAYQYEWNPSTREYCVIPMGIHIYGETFIVDSWETDKEYFVDVVHLYVEWDAYNPNADDFECYDSIYDDLWNHLGYCSSDELDSYLAAIDLSNLPHRRYTITKMPDGSYFLSKISMLD